VSNKNIEMARKKKTEEPKGKDFYIMNKDAKYFCGLLGGDPMWTSDENEAKVFSEESKIEALKRHASSDKPEIMYK
jgi:hypothetical protein